MCSASAFTLTAACALHTMPSVHLQLTSRAAAACTVAGGALRLFVKGTPQGAQALVAAYTAQCSHSCCTVHLCSSLIQPD